MTFRYLILSLILTAPLHVIGQKLNDKLTEYYSLTNEASWSFYKGNYADASLKFKTAFKAMRPQSTDVHMYIRCCVKLGEIVEAKDKIEYCMRSFGEKLYMFLHNDYGIESNDKRFLDIEKKEESLLHEFYTMDRIEQTSLINHYFLTDYFFSYDMPRMRPTANCTAFEGELVPEIKYLYDTTYTMPFLSALIKHYKYPDAYDIGEIYDDYFHLLLRHNRQEKHILDSALVRGKISPFEYASLVDYHYNWNWSTRTPKNNYGPNLKKISGHFVIGEIDNIENVDDRRKNIGLMPLWKEAKIRKYELSKEYKEFLKSKGMTIE